MALSTKQFLAAHDCGHLRPVAITGDASPRRYFRLLDGDEKPSGLIFADAGADKGSCQPFCQISDLLLDLGLSAPRVEAWDFNAGFLLIEDLGEALIANYLEQPAAAGEMIDLAVDVLIHLHREFTMDGGLALPHFDEHRFSEQAMLFVDEVLPAPARDDPALRAQFRDALAPVLSAGLALPQSLLLRDYHGENLLHLPDRDGVAACGLLDFQDAGLGPVSYDLVSFLQDARREIPPAAKEGAIARYLTAFPELEVATFIASYQAMAILRHLRIIAVFTRLAGAGRTDYLRHLPRLGRLLQANLPLAAAAQLVDWLNEHFAE